MSIPKNRDLGNMHLFIQGMYGVILGVAFYKFFEANNNIIKPPSILSTTESMNFWETMLSPTINAVTKNEGIVAFKVVFFVITFLIIAHNWFSYHKHEYRKTEQQHRFGYYLPEIFALFFLSQMLVCTSNSNLKDWFGFGLLYTFCNITNAILFKNEGIMFKVITYALHIGICIAGFYLVSYTYSIQSYFIVLGVTFGFVLLLWLIKARGSAIKEQDEQGITVQKNYLEHLGITVTTSQEFILPKEANKKIHQLRIIKLVEEEKAENEIIQILKSESIVNDNNQVEYLSEVKDIMEKLTVLKK
jgi:large-conductance mechanosensitive channel